MDLHIQFTIEQAEFTPHQGSFLQNLNYLDIMVILHPDKRVETDIYYKETNCHDYLNFDSHHAYHIKENIPFNLAKRIIVFCSNENTERQRLMELKSWLLKCNYPESVIENKFHKAKLQGPAPHKNHSNEIIPFVTTNYANYDARNIATLAQSLLNNSKDERIKKVFSNSETVLSLRQPPNLQRQLTRAAFTSVPQLEAPKEPGLFKCLNSRCDLCNKGYIQQCSSFTTFNGTQWSIKTHINCNSANVIYLLVCAACDNTYYAGKTNCLRKRMNVHKSSANLGNSTNIFDNHVFRCKRTNNYTKEPLFYIFAFMSVKDEKLLIPYERYIHNCGHDSMNR